MDLGITISQLGGDSYSPSGSQAETTDSQDTQDTTSSGNAQGQDNTDLLDEVNQKYQRWRQQRRPHEATWFVNAARVRGLNQVRWNPILNVLESKKTPAHRSRDVINLILPKVKAKLSKFLKSRAIPVVLPTSNDHEDILNAQGTTKVLEYLWEKLNLEEKYEEALLWAMQTGKAFWWVYWDPGSVAQLREPQPLIGKAQTFNARLGDVGVEVGTAFEVLVSDPGITHIQNQTEIMRVKVRKTKDVEKMFGLPQGSLTSEVKEGELFQYQRQIANLGARSVIGLGAEQAYDDTGKDGKPTYTTVKELFTAPSAEFPNGRYIVTGGGKILHQEQELPYGLANTQSPYPVVEFADMLTGGQFWPSTMVEQLSGAQTQYTRLRNQLDEQLKLQTHPWIFIPMQARVAKEAFGTEAGQKIPFNFQPGMPAPQQWIVRPEPIVQDVYKTMDIIRTEMDQMSSLYPAAMGQEGASSGFDTNLLQEAADSVHAPDIRRNELALKDAAYKIRRIAKMGYDIPRLVTIAGREGAPEVFEFSHEQIDEHANIIIDTGSALPNSKAMRIDAILKLDERQVFGQIGSAERNRRLLKMLQLGTSIEDQDIVAKDEDQSRLENLGFTRQQPVDDPMPWEDHDLHYEIHTNLLKSAEIKGWQPQQRTALIRHTILHVKWKNPTNALQLAAVFNMQDVIQDIQQTMQIQQSMLPPPMPPPPIPPKVSFQFKDLTAPDAKELFDRSQDIQQPGPPGPQAVPPGHPQPQAPQPQAPPQPQQGPVNQGGPVPHPPLPHPPTQGPNH